MAARSFDEAFADDAVEQMARRGVEFRDGLSPEELRAVEEAVGTSLPNALELFLARALPTRGWRDSTYLPDWRGDPGAVMARARDWVWGAFEFDITAGQYWYRPWGPVPDTLDRALGIARAAMKSGPALIPIYSHRFVVAGLPEPLCPVLSIYQAGDSIIYGNDLADYLHREFGIDRPTWARNQPPDIPHWGALFDLESEHGCWRPAERPPFAPAPH